MAKGVSGISIGRVSCDEGGSRYDIADRARARASRVTRRTDGDG